MVAVRTLTRAAVVVLMVAAPTIWYACSESAPDSPAGPSVAPSVLPRGNVMDLRGALAVLRRHSPRLLETPGIVGTAVTKLPDGRAGVLILAERAGIARLPDSLDGVPVTVRVTGRIMAFTDPTQRMRPAHPGFSVGHPLITAGTIGARVRDALGRVYILSNNHVLANSNNASIGDPEYQPGPYDGGTSADQIATLTDFQTISFASNGSNTIDAAIALSSTDLLDNAVPSDEGYGMPNSTIFGDADGDGVVAESAFDNIDGFKRFFGFQPNTRAAVLVFGLFHGFGLATKLQEFALSPNGLVANIVSFNVGVEIGQVLALTAVLIALSYWRTRSGFLRHAFATNAVVMGCGFLLVGYQLSGYWVSTL